MTQERAVDIYIHGAWAEMRLHNDGDGWGDWQPLRNSLRWTLANRAGEQSVTAEVRNGAASAVMSDTITVDAVALDLPDGSYLHYLPLVAGD